METRGQDAGRVSDPRTGGWKDVGYEDRGLEGCRIRGQGAGRM
jgi:hypothetical protein